MKKNLPHIHRWTSAYKKYSPILSVEQKNWLLDRGSLTRRLMGCSQHSFRVNVVCEGVARMLQHEKQVLNNPSDCGWVREVELIVDGQVWVFARSVVPLSTLTGPDLKLRHLGNKPLGHFLFSSPRYQRSQFQIGRILNSDKELLWGRRSIFTCSHSHKSLLVSETFLPVVFSG